MPATPYATVNPELLRWARATAGLDLHEAARKLNVKAERLSEWEAGTAPPTVAQIRSAARVYKRPLAAFFLPSPPVEPPRPRDFRRVYGRQPPPASPALLLEIRRARRRRDIAIELCTELGIDIRAFPLHATLTSDPDIIAEQSRSWLGVQLVEQVRWRRPEIAFNEWVSRLERHLILVCQTSAVKQTEMRGLSIGERILPVIVLNSSDVTSAQTFTLMHEFVHLMLQESGVCDPEQILFAAQGLEERVEVFCNRVAGAILVPAQALLGHSDIAPLPGLREWDDNVIQRLANTFAVSREVILRRLLILGKTTEAFYQRKRSEYGAEYKARADAEKKRPKKGFAPHYRLVIRNNGRRYTRLVLEALVRDHITEADVSDYLGVQIKHLDNIATAVATTPEDT